MRGTISKVRESRVKDLTCSVVGSAKVEEEVKDRTRGSLIRWNNDVERVILSAAVDASQLLTDPTACVEGE